MDFITKNKIAHYIEQYPDAKNALLVWWREFTVLHGSMYQPHDEKGERLIYGFSGIHGDYRLAFVVNPWLQTGYILAFGEKEEVDKCSILQQETFFSNSLRSRLMAGAESDIAKRRRKLSEALNSASLAIHNEDEYNNALNFILELFAIDPQQDDFHKLALLVKSVKRFEEENIHLPDLAIHEIIKLKMAERNMIPEDLVKKIGTLTQVADFLSGKETIAQSKISQLVKYFSILYF